VPWSWSEQRYGELLRVAGGFERLLFDMESQPLAPNDIAGRRELATRIHRRKNEIYAALVHGGAIKLRPGVRELMDDCAQAGLRMAIVTTTSRGNVAALLHAQLGRAWPEWFAAIVCAEDAPLKKPDPQAYWISLERLALPATSTLAIEDSPAGVTAARAVGIPVIVARSRYFADEPVRGALAVGPDLGNAEGWLPEPTGAPGRIGLAQLRAYIADAQNAAPS
jgi:HAD superfamily hydrolase (TIGR01509 family)